MAYIDYVNFSFEVKGQGQVCPYFYSTDRTNYSTLYQNSTSSCQTIGTLLGEKIRKQLSRSKVKVTGHNYL